MRKSNLFIVLCTVMFVQPVNAATIVSTVTNGNSVLDYGSYSGTSTTPGYSELDVTFNNLQPVQINFDNSVAANDDILIYLYNNTGTGWSAFDFQMVDSGVSGPFTVDFVSGTYLGVNSSGYDSVTGLFTGITLLMDNPEYDALLNVSGTISATPLQQYSLILTPSAVPVPAAVWLFGSGLLGLVGVARRRR